MSRESKETTFDTIGLTLLARALLRTFTSLETRLGALSDRGVAPEKLSRAKSALLDSAELLCDGGPAKFSLSSFQALSSKIQVDLGELSLIEIKSGYSPEQTHDALQVAGAAKRAHSKIGSEQKNIEALYEEDPVETILFIEESLLSVSTDVFSQTATQLANHIFRI